MSLRFSHMLNMRYAQNYTNRPRGHKTFFVLTSTEHEISTPHKTIVLKAKDSFAFKLSNVSFIMLINVKMPTIEISEISDISQRN